MKSRRIKETGIMGKNRKFKKNLQLFSLLFCLPIILIGLLIRVMMIGNIHQTFVKQHTDNVQHQVDYVNRQINQLELLGTGWGYNIQQKRQFSNISIQDIEQIKELSQELFFIQNSNTLIKDAQLAFFTDDPFMIKDGGTWQINDVLNFDYYQIDNNKEFQWRTTDAGDLLFIQRLGQATPDEAIYFSLTLNRSSLRELLKVINLSEEGAATMTVNNQIVASYGAPILDRYTVDKFYQNANLEFENQGTRYNLISLTTNRLTQEWTIYSVVLISSITEPIKNLSNMLIIISGILLILTFLLTRWFAKIQYQPVEETMMRLFGTEEWENQNEFEYIQTKWQQIMDQQLSLELSSKSNEKRLKQSIIAQLVKGNNGYLTEEELVKLAFKNGLQTENETFRLLLIQLTDFVPNRKTIENDSGSISNFILENVVNDLADIYFKDFGIATYTEDGVCLYTTLKVDDNCRLFSEDVSRQLNVLTGRLVSVTIANATKNLKQLPKDYSDLFYYRDYQLMSLENQLLIISDISQHVSSHYLYPDYLEKQLMTSIKMQNIKELKQSTQQFVTALLVDTNQQIYLLEGVKRLYDEVNFILVETNVLPTKYTTRDNLLTEIKGHLDPAKVAMTLFDHYLKPATLLFKEKASDNYVETIRQIIEYLGDNYQDPSISLDQQAEINDLEVTFLSREFKKVVGLNFVDYLTNLRLEKAKKMLASSSKKINDIAEEIGYNSSYFNRLFKKKFNMTPGQYRKENSHH